LHVLLQRLILPPGKKLYATCTDCGIQFGCILAKNINYENEKLALWLSRMHGPLKLLPTYRYASEKYKL
jgi:hypothetical protein